jgi:hypothetical protein
MNDESKPIKLIISGKLSYEENITLSQAAQIIAFVDSSSSVADTSSLSPSQTRLASPAPIVTTSNPREALEASGAKTNPEKIVAFALYVAQEGEKETFTLEDVKPLFRRAREATPRNISRDLDTAIRSGWIAESEIKGEFYVTDKASRVIENSFDAIRGNRVNGNKKRTSSIRKPRKGSTTIPDSFREIDEITPTSDEFGDYHKLKTKTDKFLWAVNLAKMLSIPGVSNQEVVWLTDKLGEGIATQDVAGYFRQNRNAGRVNRSTQDNKIRITPIGEEYLRNKQDH